MWWLKKSISFFFIITLLGGMIILGFVHNTYALIWIKENGFSFISRQNLTSSTLTVMAPLPGLLLYLSLFLFGNTTIIYLFSKKKLWWKKMIMIYFAAVVVCLSLYILHYFSPETRLYLGFAQIIKEALLSPLPSMILIPILYLQHYNLNNS